MPCTAAIHAVRRDLVEIVLGLGLVAVCATPALADDLTFSANCQNVAAIKVTIPNTGITFRKNPNSPTTRPATATISRVVGLNNITIPAGGASCFYVVAGNDSYCFQARSSADIINVNAVPGTNTAGAPACQ